VSLIAGQHPTDNYRVSGGAGPDTVVVVLHAAKRAALWILEQLDTLWRTIIQRAGRLVRPNGRLVLSMSANPAVEEETLHHLKALQAA